METLNLIKKSIVIFLATIILACGAETLVALVFIPAFAGPWPVEDGNGYAFNIQSDDEGEKSGVIFGEESNYPKDSDGEDNILSGSFDGLNIQFTIDREQDGKIKYTGKMIPKSDEDHTIIRIELNSSEGKLVLSPE